MQITVSARHGDLNSTSQEKVKEKVQKLPRIFDRLTAINVTADLENRDNLWVELRVSVEHHDDFVASDHGGELMATLDGVVHKMEQQLRKHKEKLTDHKATGVKHIAAPEPPGDE